MEINVVKRSHIFNGFLSTATCRVVDIDNSTSKDKCLFKGEKQKQYLSLKNNG